MHEQQWKYILNMQDHRNRKRMMQFPRAGAARSAPSHSKSLAAIVHYPSSIIHYPQSIIRLLLALLSFLGLAGSSLADPQVVAGIPSMAQRHTTINFSELARIEAEANLTAFRTNPSARPFMSPIGTRTNQGQANLPL